MRRREGFTFSSWVVCLVVGCGFGSAGSAYKEVKKLQLS